MAKLTVTTPRNRPAALVSVAVAMALFWVPYNAGLLVAGILAMIAGSEAERRGLV